MMYLETVFVCLLAPLLLALVLSKGESRLFVGSFILGMLAALLAAYINGFIVAAIAKAGMASMTMIEATVRLTPICEEFLKALPVFFYVALMREDRERIVTVSLAVGLGFATLENSSYIMQFGNAELSFALVRGFSVGIMHTICAAIIGCGLKRLHLGGHLHVASAFTLLCAATTYHAIYNLLVAVGGVAQTCGYLLPILTAMVLLAFIYWPRKVTL